MSLRLKTLRRMAWALSAWCLVFIVVLAGRPSFTNASIAVRGVSDPVVALQTARDADEVEAILGEAPSADREVMRLKQYINFALTAGYLALAMVVAAALKRSRRSRIALGLGVLAVLAALFDARTSLNTLRVVNLQLSQVTPAMLASLRMTSVAKWILLATAMALLGTVTFKRRQWYLRAAGFLSLAGAAVTVFGLFYNSVLVWGGLLLFLGLFLTAATLKELTYEPAP